LDFISHFTIQTSLRDLRNFVVNPPRAIDGNAMPVASA
jgi:hypothetical protein